MSTPNRNGLDIEAILNDLCVGEVCASISWSSDGRIDVKLGDTLNGYDAEARMDTFAEAAEWLRDKALIHYPHSKFSRKYAELVSRPDIYQRPDVNTGMRWSEMDLVDLGHMLTRKAPIKEIASYLRRSQAEVRDKMAELGRACNDPSRHHHRERRLASSEH
jgi:hypothetical protein